MLAKQILVRRAAFVLAVPVATAALIGVAQWVAPASSHSAATTLTGSGGSGGAADVRLAGQSGGATPTGGYGTVTPSASSSGAPAARSAPAAPLVAGRYVLRGPAKAPAGSEVVFVLQGPGRLVKGDRSAPFVVPIDTRTLPDGDYRLVVTLVSGHHRSVLSTTRITVAQAHSQDMATRNYFDHNTPEGKSPFDRMTAAGYAFSSAAENIAAGQRTPADVVTAWMNSAGHRANILNCGLTQIGVGYATGGSYGVYWTQDFGTPR